MIGKDYIKAEFERKTYHIPHSPILMTAIEPRKTCKKYKQLLSSMGCWDLGKNITKSTSYNLPPPLFLHSTSPYRILDHQNKEAQLVCLTYTFASLM